MQFVRSPLRRARLLLVVTGLVMVSVASAPAADADTDADADGVLTQTASATPPTLQNDCGTGGDAGGSHAAASAITTPKTNCTGNLFVSLDNVDWYQFWVNQGEAITASIDPAGSEDFNLCLVNPSGTVVTCSTNGPGLVDAISHTTWTMGYWRLKVDLIGLLGDAYTMSVSSVVQNDCDTWGDAGGTSATSASIGLPKTNCSGQLITSADTEDWYHFYVETGHTINASMTPNAGANFNICLYTSSGVLLAGCSAGTVGGTDTLTRTVATWGWYRLRVFTSSGAGSYTMSLSATTPQNDCGTGGDAGNSHATASLITLPKTNCSAQMVSSAPDTEDWYQFAIASGRTINASITSNTSADFDICIYNPSGTLVASCTYGGHVGGTDTLGHAATTSGNYRLRVQGSLGTGPYTMSVWTSASPQNDCGTGTDAGNTHGTASLITLPKTNCPAVLYSSTDTADWYQFAVASGRTINASMTPNYAADFDICIYNPSGTLVAGCSGGWAGTTDTLAHTATTTGNYRLKVVIFSGSGPYTMSVAA